MKQIWLTIFLFFASIIHIQSKVYVVSIGIADYPGKENDLRISDNDAKTIAKVFLATKDASVKVLTNEDARCDTVGITEHDAHLI